MTVQIKMLSGLVRRVALALLLIPGVVSAAGKPVVMTAGDGVAVYGTFTPAAGNHRGILLLFHQAGASRHEYDPLIPTFTELGYATLAIDQRSGGSLFGGRNETVARLGKSTGYLAAMPDLEAAMAWARAHKYTTIVAVGSSYSSSLVLLLAARHAEAIDAVASFSPGEYFADKDLVKRAAAKVTVPVYITTDPKEEDNVDDVLRDARGANITRYRPVAGVHGASTLVCARDPAGCKANLHSFVDFLRTVGGNEARPERGR